MLNIFWPHFQVVMAIKCRGELLDGLYTGINSQHITLTSKMVQKLFLVLFIFLLVSFTFFRWLKFLAQMDKLF